MNTLIGLGAALTTEKIKGDIVTKTLDTLNSTGTGKAKKRGMSSMSDTYNFAKDVLSAAYEAKGTIIGTKS